MKNHMRKVLSSVLLLSLILSQSSSLIYSIKASSEYVSDITSEEDVSVDSEEDVSVDSETIEIESSQSEQVISEDTTTAEEGIISKVVNSFKSDRSLARATNGATSIEVVNYNETTGLEKGVIYDVKVTADFGSDITSSGKTLEFTLPDGMVFKQIPVVTGLYNTSSVDTTILAAMGSDDPLSTATKSITVPTKETTTNSTFGTVKYEFNEGTKGVSVTFKVQMDSQKILNTHVMSENMTATSAINGSDLGTASQEMIANSSDRGVKYYLYDQKTTTEVLASTATEDYIGYTYGDFFYREANLDLAVKKLTAYSYYPEGSEYVGFETSNSYLTITDDPANSRIIITLNDPNGYATTGILNFLQYVKFKFPEGTTPGVYSNPQANYVEFEGYNGEQFTVTNSRTYSVEVVDQKVNQMTILQTYNFSDDNSIPDISIGSMRLKVANKKSYTIEDQVVEWKVDSTLKTTVLTFPYDMLANNNQKVSKMMYKTHQDDVWITATQDQLDAITYSSGTGVIELADIGLTDSETLSEIRVWTGSYGNDYLIGEGSSSHITYTALYADVIEPATSGKITYTQYDENNVSETQTRSSITLRASEYDAVQTANANARVKYYNSSNSVSNNAIAGDTVRVESTLTSYGYHVANLQSIKNPVLYIRETEEYKVDINNMTLTYMGSEIDYTYEKKVDVNGNVVYKVITSPDVVLGTFFNSETNDFEARTLVTNFNLIIDPLATSDINSNELVLYNSNEYDIKGLTLASYIAVTDKNDMDGDGSTTDSLMANIENILLMKPNTNIIVQSAFSKDGTDDNVEYINGDDSTVAVLEPGETYEYIATVINNAGESVDEFTAIIPVPKTGDNFGSFFQDEAFTWTMTLASLPTAPTGFEFYYSTDVTASTVLNGATWTKTPKNLDDVKMIKMVATHTIVAGETVEVRVPYTIGETYDSTISGNKAGNVNAFKVAYEQKTSSYNGVLSGTWAGATYILAPEIELEDLNYIVGNSADLEEKVVVTDFYGEQIGMTDITYDGSNVPVVDGLYSEVGTYQVEYTATDRNGLTVTGTRLIKIDGLPEVEAEDQVYYITESDIEGQVDDAGVGYANRAGSEVGSALIKEEIGTTYEILSYSETLTEESSEVGSETSSEVDSEVSSEEDSETAEVETLAFAAASETVVDQTFDKVGYYDVKYTAVDSFGQVAEKTVLVTVLDVEETPSEPTEEPSESKSDKLSEMTIADTGANQIATLISIALILVALVTIKKNLKI